MRKRKTIKTALILNKQNTFSMSMSKYMLALVVIVVQCLIPISPIFANEIESTETIFAQSVESAVETFQENEVVHSEPSTEISTTVQQDEVPTPPEVVVESIVPIEVEIDDTSPVQTEIVQIEPTDTPSSSIEISSSNGSTETPITPSQDVSGGINLESTTTPAEIPITNPENSELPSQVEEEVKKEIKDNEGPLENVLNEAENNIDSSTSTEITVLQTENHVVVNDTNRFSFSEKECARVSDGSFYCSKDSVPVTTTHTERVFAAPDIDGDEEIFIEHNGELTQISTNQTDDSAPYYDENSESLVWHRLIDERFQIVSFDLTSGEEKVLTTDRYNNMQPSRYGDVTVWQGWVGNDWEIMIDENGEQKMLTDNTTHDIGPRINGVYVIWQSFETETWKAKVYNLKTKNIETISDAEAVSIENPRFVLVYDAKSPNGDVETRGYDPISGTAVPLSAQPMETPSSIPNADQTGEERALINTNAQLKAKTDEEPDGDPLRDEPLIPEDDFATSTTNLIIPLPLDPNSGTSEFSGGATSSVNEIVDIVIPPINEILPAIADLVIEPYIGIESEEVLPQQNVATSS